MILTFTNGINQVTVVVKNRFFTRFLGLMGQKKIPYDGIFLTPSSGIHMFFMRTTIDVLFLKKEGRGYRVIRKMEKVRPWQWVPFVRGTTDILELRVGLGGRFQEGDLVTECTVKPRPLGMGRTSKARTISHSDKAKNLISQEKNPTRSVFDKMD